MPITPKENYLMLMRGEIPEYVPAGYIERCSEFITEDQIAPTFAPNGPITTVYGVTYVGSADLMNGAVPTGAPILTDITKWRDVIHNPDNSHRDWEGYYKKQTDRFDRVNRVVKCHGGDYFLTLVSFMGFADALLAMYEEPEEVYALFDYVSRHYLEVMEKQLDYVKPDIYTIMDDDSAALAPFFSLDTYRELVRPFHEKHAKLALERGVYLDRHDCGHCELFIDDWVQMGIRSWNPAQIMNDLPGIKKKYGRKLAICGGWDNLKYNEVTDMEELREALRTYTDTFAPGGRFSYMAMAGGRPGDPLAETRRQVVKDFYFEYARDWYKTH